MLITGTFLDEITADIPHQNWGEKEWDREFATMKMAGIDTVIMIRCGNQRFITYPSEYLMEKRGAYRPPLDLVDIFLRLADKYSIDFYFGLYDGGCMRKAWFVGSLMSEVDDCKFVAEEVWKRYGHHKSFKGWYLNHEIGIGDGELYILDERTEYDRIIGNFVKEISGGLPTMISPYISGSKAQANPLDITAHDRLWNRVLSTLQGAVDIVAFQDGHCEYDELEDYIKVNKALADKYNMISWTNCESFDRDMPIKFLPIKWEKMRLKLEAAEKTGVEKAITFEFSHFMSPHSMYSSAHGLFDRYMEYREEVLKRS